MVNSKEAGTVTRRNEEPRRSEGPKPGGQQGGASARASGDGQDGQEERGVREEVAQPGIEGEPDGYRHEDGGDGEPVTG